MGNRPRVIKSGGTKHGLHALITLFTCGMWAPVWFIIWLVSPKKTKTFAPGDPGNAYIPPGQGWPPRT
jgi:hypothetical protein